MIKGERVQKEIERERDRKVKGERMWQREKDKGRKAQQRKRDRYGEMMDETKKII